MSALPRPLLWYSTRLAHRLGGFRLQDELTRRKNAQAAQVEQHLASVLSAHHRVRHVQRSKVRAGLGGGAPWWMKKVSLGQRLSPARHAGETGADAGALHSRSGSLAGLRCSTRCRQQRLPRRRAPPRASWRLGWVGRQAAWVDPAQNEGSQALRAARQRCWPAAGLAASRRAAHPPRCRPGEVCSRPRARPEPRQPCHPGGRQVGSWGRMRAVRPGTVEQHFRRMPRICSHDGRAPLLSLNPPTPNPR